MRTVTGGPYYAWGTQSGAEEFPPGLTDRTTIYCAIYFTPWESIDLDGIAHYGIGSLNPKT